MLKVMFRPSGKEAHVKRGQTLFEAAKQVGLPVASSCDAEYVCGKCNMQILLGSQNLSPQTATEKALLRRERNPEIDRISCQTLVLGDCVVTTRYW